MNMPATVMLLVLQVSAPSILNYVLETDTVQPDVICLPSN